MTRAEISCLVLFCNLTIQLPDVTEKECTEVGVD